MEACTVLGAQCTARNTAVDPATNRRAERKELKISKTFKKATHNQLAQSIRQQITSYLHKQTKAKQSKNLSTMTDSSSSSGGSLSRASSDEESAVFRAIALRTGAPQLQPLTPLKFGGVQSLNRKRSQEAAAPTTASVQCSSQYQWRVSDEEIPRVPEYPLEQTSLSLVDLSLEQITDRITRVLESQSLLCSYSGDEDENDQVDDDEERLPGRVDCTSQDQQFKFVVQVYRTETGYCVEVQRRRGSSLDFSAVRRPLFQMLKTGSLSTVPRFTPPTGFSPNKKFRIMPCTPLTRA